MRYIAFKQHRILISFDVVDCRQKKPAGRGEVKSIVVVIDHILELRMANPR